MGWVRVKAARVSNFLNLVAAWLGPGSWYFHVRRYVPSRGDGFFGREGTAAAAAVAGAGDRRDFDRRMGIGRAGHNGHSGASQQQRTGAVWVGEVWLPG